MWIYEQKHWPEFTWDTENLTVKLAAVRHRQGRLLGRIESLGFTLRQEANLITLTHDVVKSSAIEGENFSSTEVRSSIARHLGIEVGGLVPASRDVDGMVEMMLDATQGFSQPLTKARLFRWHTSLFPIGRSGIHPILVGDWRSVETGPMRVISGPFGREKIHFEAPIADRLESEMTVFLNWFENTNNIDPVLKAGIAHFWFVTIHPFEDGNGRIARAIGDMALARAEGISDRFYSLSKQIEMEKKQYYLQLEKQQRDKLDITPWLTWFLDCLGRAIDSAEASLSHVLLKAKLWERINQYSFSPRQLLIINRMLEEDFKGYMNTAKYSKLAKCSTDTALRDIQDLKNHGIFLQNAAGGRSTSYRLTD